ncbi:MAG: NAD(P)-dependent oxidoreductase, partial [Bacteroidetes bacterium]
MNIGIIGGNGFVGSGIRTTLQELQHECTSITRENYAGLKGTSFDVLINANGNSKKYLASSSPKEEFQASVTSVQHSLLDFTYDLYIHCSSVDVYPNHEETSQNSEEASIDVSQLSLYGLHKYLAEILVRKYARRWLILRFGGFVGEELRKNSIYDMLHGVPLRVNIESKYQYF